MNNHEVPNVIVQQSTFIATQKISAVRNGTSLSLIDGGGRKSPIKNQFL